jgi:hypothetical protein
MKRELCLALTLMLLLAGCDTGTPATPQPTSFHYSNAHLGVTADLPHNDWIPATGYDGDPAARSNDMLMSPGASLAFRVDTGSQSDPASELNFRLLVLQFTGQYFTPPVSTRDETFHGYQAVRTEGTWSGASALLQGYHWVEYIFLSGSKLYHVGAGSRPANWDKGAKGDVETLLASVQLSNAP